MVLNLRNFLVKEKILVTLIAAFAAISLLSPAFLTFENIKNLLVQVSIYGIVAFGMTFAILCGEFDLSVGAIMACSGIIVVQITPVIGLIPAIIAALLFSAIVGLINGLLVSKAKINSFIVTLSAMVAYKGVALTISGGNPIIASDDSFQYISNGKFLEIPYVVFYFVIVLAISQYIMTKTSFGRNIYATGGNLEVAWMAGLRTRFYKTSVFVICSFLSGVGGVLLASRLNTASPIMGDDAALNIVSYVVIGGTSLSGGHGSALRTLIGIMLLGVLANAMNLLNINTYIQQAIKGIILIAIVATDSYYKNHKLGQKV